MRTWKGALKQRRSCRAKRRFENQPAAEAAIKADAWKVEDGVTLRTYKCPCCPGWHLTSNPKDMSSNR